MERTSSQIRRLRLAELIAAISIAEDLGVGLPKEHVLRCCYVAVHLARELRLPVEGQRDVFYTALLEHAGCTSYSTQMAAFLSADERAARRDVVYFGDYTDQQLVMQWIHKYSGVGMAPRTREAKVRHVMTHGQEFFHEGFLSSGEAAQRIARRLKMPEGVVEALPLLYEHWSGIGQPYGLRGDTIPITARVVSAAMYLTVWHILGGRDGAQQLARNRSGKAFDPAVASAFLSLAQKESFWSGFEEETVWDLTLGLEPLGPWLANQSDIDAVAEAFADFVDMKVYSMAGHSRRVAKLAKDMAIELGLASDVVWRAGLMHDVGYVDTPAFVLNKPEHALTPLERASLKNHPMVADAILGMVPVFSAERRIIAAHHERLDGQGFPRRQRGAEVPLEAQVIAAADTFDDLTHRGPGHVPLRMKQATQRMRAEVGKAYSAEVYRAFESVAPVPAIAGSNRTSQPWPAALTSREVEVLRLLVAGASRKDVARRLTLTENTVRHHLEHIYGKIGVSTRVGAVLFAMEHDLLP